MSKKLIAVLIMVALLMLGAASLTKKDTNGDKPASNTPGSLGELSGKPAPDFTLSNQKNQAFKLSDFRGRKVVLFFNEGVMCYPACWNQMAALGTDERLNNEKVVSASIVVDSPTNWTSAFKKMPELGKGIVLFDSDKSVSIKYGMLSLESSMHRGSMPGHTYIIVDSNSIVRYMLDDPKMSIQNETIINELSKI